MISQNNLWYHKIEFVISQILDDFVISQIRFCDITNSNLWYHKIYFMISQIRDDFVISQIRFCDIIKSNLWYHQFDFVISKNQVDFVISQIRFCDITKSSRICDITNSIMWYHKIVLTFQFLRKMIAPPQLLKRMRTPFFSLTRLSFSKRLAIFEHYFLRVTYESRFIIMIVFYELNTNMTGFSGLQVFQLHTIVFHYHG